MQVYGRSGPYLIAFLAYLVTSQVGLALPLTGEAVSPIWPGAGVSLALMLLLGRRVWPAILAADFISNTCLDPHRLGVVTLFAVGNTLEPLLSASLIRRILGADDRLLGPKQVATILVAGGLVGPAVAGAVYVAALVACFPRPPAGLDVWRAWSWWASSDGVGVVLLTLVVLSWVRQRGTMWEGRILELGLLLAGAAAAVLVAFAAFDRSLSTAFAYLAFPFVIWAGRRFDLRVTSLAVLVIASVFVAANWYIAPASGVPIGQRLLWANLFVAVLASIGFVLSATGQECRESNRALHGSEERYRELFENANDVIMRTDLDGRILEANKVLEQLSGYSREELLAMTAFDLLDEPSRQLAREMLARKRESDGRTVYDVDAVAKDGRTLRLEISSRFAREQGRPTGIQIFARDLTRRIELETQLRHAQKMDAVGRLAGGIAHDFNNLLTVVGGHSEMLLEAVGDGLRPHVDAIRAAAERGSALTRQLLAFGRRQVLQPRVADPNDLIRDTVKLLGRLIGEHIHLSVVLSPEIGRIEVDPDQFGQILMNLVVNARDAMPKGGDLVIETGEVALGVEDCPLHHEMSQPGRYVTITVRDTGVGMDKATTNRIFEPFFTTKPSGQGTGLGLATVYGIVTQSGGFIRVYSEPGQGAVFRVYLPVTDAGGGEETRLSVPVRGGTETLLLVEDEVGICRLVASYLRGCGYTVLEATSAEQALEIASAYQGAIDLLVSDVVMPGLGGPDLAPILRSQRPAMATLFVSGYPGACSTWPGPESSPWPYLQKPFTLAQLAGSVRDCLDARRSA